MANDRRPGLPRLMIHRPHTASAIVRQTTAVSDGVRQIKS